MTTMGDLLALRPFAMNLLEVIHTQDRSVRPLQILHAQLRHRVAAWPRDRVGRVD